jgi:hypothetical protein
MYMTMLHLKCCEAFGNLEVRFDHPKRSMIYFSEEGSALQPDDA